MTAAQAVESAERALAAHAERSGESRGCAASMHVVNLLADVCHYCAAHELDVDDLWRIASLYYLNEIGTFK